MHIHSEVTGTGPVVVLTHGFAASSHMFATTVPAIATDHTVIAWDMPGHGRSDSPDDPSEYSVKAFLEAMLALVDDTGAERAVFLGHSLGGYLSLEMVLAHPDRAAGLVLVDTGPGYRNDAARDGWNRMAAGYARNLEERGLAGMPGGDELSTSVHQTASGLALTARNVLAQHDSHVIDALASIEVPTLVVVGANDEPFVNGSSYMATKIPSASLAVIEGAGHAPPISHSDEFNAVLRTYLDGLAAFMSTPEDVRRDVRAWLGDNWDPDLSLLAWRTKLVESGWATPTWPADWYGRGLPGWAEPIVHEEFAAAGAVGTAVGGGMGLAAPTLLAHGSDELKRRLLPRAITGEDTWCQLFSEPTNGSDLAGLATHAERDGDEWVVNGQKLWSTSAHHADVGLLLARTDPDVPKHRGISYFVLPMHQPGVEVRPVHQMNEHSSFNEVFLADARVPADNIVGMPGDGWRIAMTTLAFERQFATVRARSGSAPTGRAAEEAAAEAEEYYKTYAWYPQRAGRADLVQQVAELEGRTDDPIARQQMAGLVALRRAHEWTARRAQAARAAGRAPGSEGSLGKLAASRVAQASARTHSLLAGADGQLRHGDSILDGVITEVLLSVPAQSIAGGTDEIQHNIIGEKVLDLPREPSVDRDIPYREIRR